MGLFQKSVIKKYLLGLDQDSLKTAWNKYAAHFQNPVIQEHIRNSKEEEYQEGFVRDLFVNVLGYTLKPQPDFNFVLEKKTETDATKSDGALLKQDTVIGVVELKDTETTELDKIEKQVFGYKNKHRQCVYVITSNFEKLRIYINDAVDFLDFNLFNLTEQQFALFYLCLHQKSIEKDLPLKMKQASLAEEESVTKKLYADYSQFKRNLFSSLVQHNPQYDKLELFKKTQKLLDRFLFLLFAEDRLLLPVNSVRGILEEWEKLKELDNYVPLYERFKKFFGYLNTGHDWRNDEIFAYNGGLFAPDDLLDNISIDDKILNEGTRLLSSYDFESEVDVNILGHIFEHSLSEIEEVQAELAGNVIEKSKTKRKKDGVFYTPRYITKYIVENTVGTLCQQKKQELSIIEEDYIARKFKTSDAEEKRKKKLLATLGTYRSWLFQLTICDPACGSGAFLNQALEFLITEHRYIDELKAKLFGDLMVLSDVETTILENNLFGVDINEEAIEIARLSLWLRTARKGRKLNDLSKNIKCGNSLIDDPAVAGSLAFNWKEQFPQIFDKGGFDVIIGNPPYGINLTEQEQKYFSDKFPLTSYKTNLYVLFLERMFQVFENTHVCFIIPKSLLFNSYYSNLRKHFILNSKLIELFSITDKVFEDAEVGSSLIIHFKTSSPNNLQNNLKLISAKSFFDYPDNCIVSEAEQGYFLSIPNTEISIVSSALDAIKSKILNFPPLDTFFNLKNGLNPGNVKHILISSSKDTNNHKPIIWGKDISHYEIAWSGDYVNYDENIASKIDLSEIRSKKGMKAQSKIDFALRSKELFENAKILVRKTGDSLIAALDEGNNYYFDTLVHGIYEKSSRYRLIFLLPVLNSKAATKFYRILHDIKGKVFAKISLDNLSSFPLPDADEAIQKTLIELGTQISLCKSELTRQSNEFLNFLQVKYGTLSLSTKLQNWHLLASKDFLKELGKQKIKFSLSEEAEWLKYFEEQKAKATAIQQQIDDTDKQIDQLVYTIYGLTDEEKSIIENA